MKEYFKKLNYANKYTIFGAIFGCFFPILGTLIICIENNMTLFQAQLESGMTIWIIDSAPFILALVARVGGRHYDKLVSHMTEGQVIHDEDHQFDQQVSSYLSGKKRIFLHTIIFLGLMFTSHLLYNSKRNQEIESIGQFVERARTKSLTSLKWTLEERLRVLDRMANRFVGPGSGERKRWIKDVESYLKDYKGFQAIEWADASTQVKWILPLEANKAALDLVLNKDVSRNRAIERAGLEARGVFTEPIQLKQGGKGFLTIHPIFSAISNDLTGYILGVYRVKDLFRDLLNPDAKLKIFMNDQPVYEQGKNLTEVSSNLIKSHLDEFDIRGTKFGLNLSATPEMIAAFDKKSNSNYFGLLFILLSVTLSGLILSFDFFKHRALQALVKLRSSDSRSKHLARVVDTAGVGVTAVDREGIVTGWNKTAEHIFGYSESEVMGHPISVIVPQDKVAETKEALRLAWSGNPVHLETVRLSKNKKRVHIDLTLSPIIGNSGVIETVSGIAMPIDKRLKLQEELNEKIEYLNTSTLVSYTDKKGIITYVNNHFCEVSKYAREELIGSSHSIVNSGVHAQSFWQDMWQTITSGKTWKGTVQNKASDGSMYWVQSTMMPREDIDGEIIGYVSIRVDVTAQVESERQIVQASRLASIGELAAGVGHEINNPLAIVKGNLSRIIRELAKEKNDNPRLADAHSKANEGIDRIVGIVNSLRAYSRMEGEFDQTLDLHDLISKTLILTGNMYTKEGIKIQTDLSAEHFQVRGDAGKFQQILTVLLTNAKDAVEKCDSAKITIKTSSTDVGFKMQVVDNGSGIPKKIQEKIFDSFYTTKPVGKGTGIGLGVLSKIVIDMKGSVHLDSKEGQGTSFSINLPLGSENKPKPRVNNLVEKIKLSGRALVVDDDEGIRELLVEHLEDLGLQVEQADDGDVALEKVKLKHYDYICTDMKMPRMRGEEFIREARALANGNSLYFIITGGVTVDYSKSKEEGLQDLAHGVIQKPFTEESIYKVLSSSLEEKQAAA